MVPVYTTVSPRLSSFSYTHLFDIYYCTTLNDGTELNWARNSATAGTMGTGKVLSSFRVSLWGNGVEGASYNLSLIHILPAHDHKGIVHQVGQGIEPSSQNYDDESPVIADQPSFITCLLYTSRCV